MVAVYTGDERDFAALSYGIPNMNVLNYIENQFTSLPENILSSSFFKRAYDLYNQFSGSDAIAKARATLEITNSHIDINSIRRLTTTLELQTAPPLMQRFIMSHIPLRERYLKQQVDGYSKDYLNPHGKDIGEEHYDYRRVLNGVVQTPPDCDGYKVVFYLDPLEEGDRELNAFEKFSILETWDAIDQALEDMDEDPTSLTGGKL